MVGDLGTCKLTGSYGPFVKSHIVPRSFLDLTQRKGEPPLRVYPLHARGRTTDSQTGLYDRELVTVDGERVLARFDLAANCLLNAPVLRSSYLKDEHGFIARDQSGRRVGYALSSKHYSELKLFVLSIFWRASASQRPELADFKLAADVQRRVQGLLLAGEPAAPDELSVMIVRYTNDAGVPLITPNRIEIMKIPFVQMAFGQCHFYMKTTAIETPAPIDELQLDPRRSLGILLGDFFDTRFGSHIRRKFQEFYSDADA
jgi:hypothetical protein